MRGYSIFRQKNRPHFYVCYVDVETMRWKNEATKFRVDDPQGRKKAIRYGEAKAAAYFAENPGRKNEAWSVWVVPWLEDHYRQQAKTLGRYLGAWDCMRVYLDENKCRFPSQLTYMVALKYVDWRTTQRRHSGKLISRNTAIMDLKVLGTIMREAVRRGFAISNPCDRMGLKRDRSKQKHELTDADVTKYRDALKKLEGHLPVAERWMTVSFEIALHQGCRLRETSIAMSDIDLKRKALTFHAKGRNGEKHVFTTSLHPDLVPLMRELSAAKATRTCTLPEMAARLWWSFRQDNGLGHTTFHATRVTVITRLARAGVPIQQAMRFVGHADEAVHAIYQKLQTDDLSACTNALSYDTPAKTRDGSGATV